jgi:hypothetical protein
MEFRGFDLAADVIGQFGVPAWSNGGQAGVGEPPRASPRGKANPL